MDTGDDPLWDLLARWEESYRQGQDVPAGDLCPDCPALAARLADLIDSLKRMDWLLKPPDEAEGRALAWPADFGEYTVLEQIGVGGMGHVYKALHRRMDRTVALKLLPVADPNLLRRFGEEVRSAARLHHPNVVTAYDAGEYDGRPFLVMEYVEGNDLLRHVQERGPLPVTAAVDAVAQAAKGLGYAHDKGLVHGDVKPANLLGGVDGTVKVLDLGLARVRSTDAGGEPVAGTVDYLAPEQTSETRRADPRADVYSLGCTLFFLLTGRPVFEAQTIIQKVVAHRESPAPPLHQARPEAGDRLDAVFRRMVAKRPEDRYQSMSEVVEALEGWRRSLLPAPRTSRSYRRWIWLLGLMPALAVAGAAVWWASRGRPADQAVAGAAPPPGKPGRAPGQLLRFGDGVDDNFAGIAFHPDGRHALTGSFEGVVRLWDVDAGHEVRQFRGHAAKVHGVAFSRDGRLALTGGGDGDCTVRLWDADTGEQVRCFEGHTGGVWSVAFSPNGERVLSAGDDETVRVWEVATGGELYRFNRHAGSAFSAAFSPDGRHALSGGKDHTVRYWDTASGEQIHYLGGHEAPVWAVAVSPNGRRAVSGDLASIGCVWDLEAGRLLYRVSSPTRAIFAVAFSPDGNYALTGGGTAFLQPEGRGFDFTVCLWEVESGRLVQRYEGHTAVVWGLAFSPMGDRFVSCGSDRTIRTWSTPGNN
jgi:WD40 repeat protein